MPPTVPLSKEEQKFQIIEKVNPRLVGKLKNGSDEIPCHTAFLAMDEYAKQQSIAFMNWKEDNYIVKQYVGEWLWNVLGKHYNDEQLYNLFLNKDNTKT
jgi:hypothetical protein